MFRNFRIALACALALTAACSDSPTGPVSHVAGGTCTTNIHTAVTGATSQTLDMTGQCELKELGHTTMVIHQVCLFVGTCTNTTTHTAANGDQLISNWYSGVGQNSFDGVNAIFEGIETYAGGTGRFAHATGSSTVKGTAKVDAATGGYTGQYTTTGTIVF